MRYSEEAMRYAVLLASAALLRPRCVAKYPFTERFWVVGPSTAHGPVAPVRQAPADVCNGHVAEV